MIRGITVKLHIHTQTGVDELNAAVCSDSEVFVDDVLVGEPTAQDITTTESLYGRKAHYTLAIPKGDSHKWENTEVEFFDQKFRTIGVPVEGIDANIPLKWNKKVQVERYE